MFDEIKFKNKIQSTYITEYGAEIGEVFCHIFYRRLENDPINDFFDEAGKYSFFDCEKFDKKHIEEVIISEYRHLMISAIIKECKYNEHFMTWKQGNDFIDEFLNQFDNIEKIYQNAYWEKSISNNSYKNEFDMMGWSGISKYKYYDYGFIVVNSEKIGFLWFGDES